MLNRFLLYYLQHFPFEAGKHRLSNYLKLPGDRNKPIIHTNAYGVKFDLIISEYTMRQMYLYDVYEKITVETIKKLVQPNMTFFDCGANIGNYCLNFYKLIPNANVHAFEPNSINFERLKKNAELNAFTNISLNKTGISDTSEVKEIHYDHRNMGATSFAELEGGYHKHEEVELTSIDEYCSKKNITQIDILKIDVEGYELKCVKGAERIIRNSKKMIVLLEIEAEYCKRAGYTAEFLFNYIVKMGFKAYLTKKWLAGLKPISKVPDDISCNVIFLKGY